MGGRERLIASPRHRSPHGCARMFVLSLFFHNHQVPAVHQPVVTLVNYFRQASDDMIVNPGVNIIRPSAQRGGNGEKFMAFRGNFGEHINILELRAVINGDLWRLRSAANIHSREVQAMDSIVILGALAKGRSKSRRLAPMVMKFNSLVVAASFTPLLVHCRTDFNPADEPSHQDRKPPTRRRWKGAQETTASDCWIFA